MSPLSFELRDSAKSNERSGAGSGAERGVRSGAGSKERSGEQRAERVARGLLANLKCVAMIVRRLAPCSCYSSR